MARLNEARAAIDHGDTDALKALLFANPALCMATEDAPGNRGLPLILYTTNWPGGKPNGAETVRLLLETGVDPNLRHEGGETVLHWAASNDQDEDIVTALLAGGAQVDPLGGCVNQGTPLQNAVHFGFRKAAAVLVAHGASIYNLSIAAGLGRLDLLKDWHKGQCQFATAAFRSGPDDAVGTTNAKAQRHLLTGAFQAALFCRQYEVADWFLANGFDLNYIPDDADNSCLHQAAYRGTLEMAMYLVANGADLAARSRAHNARPFEYAYVHGHPDIMHFLIDAGSQLTLAESACCGRFDHILAAKPHREQAAKLLLPTIGTRTPVNKPVHDDIRAGRHAIVHYLLQQDPALADVPIEGQTGRERAQAATDRAWLALLPRGDVERNT